MLNELANKIVREYNEDRPDFHKLADWGKSLADLVLNLKVDDKLAYLAHNRQ